MRSDDADVALRRAYLVEVRESRKKGDPRLGYSQINYGRLFVRDYWTLFAIARELDCKIEDLVAEPERPRSGPRYSEIIQASEEILETVRTLPAIFRSVVECRGRGLSWRKIQLKCDGRIQSSLRDDYDRGMKLVGRASAGSLSFLASLDNFFVVSPVPAAYVDGTLNAPSLRA